MDPRENEELQNPMKSMSCLDLSSVFPLLGTVFPLILRIIITSFGSKHILVNIRQAYGKYEVT